MLVVDDQRPQLRGADRATDEDARRGPVAQEDLVGDQVGGRALGAHLVGRLAHHQRLGLREVVGRQHLLVQPAGDGVVRLGGQDEVRGDELGALVHELEEGVLRVGAGLAKENRAWAGEQGVSLSSMYSGWW